jgi:predicted Zn-dependent peptidase
VAPGAAAGRVRARAAVPHQRSVLPNGLRVVTQPMPTARSVAVGLFVGVGSRREDEAHAGLSHLLEHLVFKGTERRNAHELALSLESLGGSLDAYTSREHTSFQARVLDEHLAQAADVVGDLIFRPTLRDEDLQLERRVVLEEIAMVDDTPDDLVFELHNAALWGEHPYGYSILGTRESVSSLGADALRDVHRRGYQPQHVVVACAGRMDHDHLLGVLGETGWLDQRRGDSLVLPPAPPTARPATATHVERESAQTHIVLGSPTVRYGDPRRYAVTLISLLLGGGMSSRLFQRVREQLGLAYSVYTFQSFHADMGVHGVYVGTSRETANLALDAIRNELSTLVRDGFPLDEFESGKNQLKGQLTLSLEGAASRMYRVAAAELYSEPYRTLDEALALVDQIAMDDVIELCRELLPPERQTVLSLGPGSGLS